MGYTHYWARPREIPAGVFGRIRRDVERVLAALPERVPEGCAYAGAPLRVCGGDGHGAPEVTGALVAFNGDAGAGMDYEAFWLPRLDSDGRDYWVRRNEGSRPVKLCWEFCKTERRPYDLAVCAALLVAKLHLGDRFLVSSDSGSMEAGAWPVARELVARVLGAVPPAELDTYELLVRGA